MAEGRSDIAYSATVDFGPASRGSKWKRRMFSVPTILGSTLLFTAFVPALLLVAPCLDLLFRGRLSATRTVVFFLAFLWAETIGLMLATALWFTPRGPRYLARQHRLQRVWARFLFAAAVRIFGVSIAVEGAELLDQRGGCLFLVRHASTMDTLLPFVVDPRRRFRYVLKEELLFDPCLDVIGHRLPNCFVRRGGDRTASEVGRVVRLGREVADDEAVVIFPEGTRYTASKRERVLKRMAEKDHPAVALARDLQCTLSPLRAGVLALGETTSDLDVVVIAHSGIESAGTLGDLLLGGLTGARLRVWVDRYPAVEVPRDPDGFRTFLAETWRGVDRRVCD